MANFCTISRAKPKAGYAATALEKIKTLSEFSKANGAIPVSYTHLTLPTNREV